MAGFVMPAYVERDYWWAYARPWAVKLFDHQLSVNTILYGRYNFLRDRALEALGQELPGMTLQLGCCYGDLTLHIIERVKRSGGRLEVIDVLPIQLERLASKLDDDDAPTVLAQMDSAALSFPDASVDRVLSFMLLHEQPPEWRERTFTEAMRVLKPGGRFVIIDYAKRAWWHPLRPYFVLLQHLKPYVYDAFHHSYFELFPGMRPDEWRHTRYFGGVFQTLVYDKPAAQAVNAQFTSTLRATSAAAPLSLV